MALYYATSHITGDWTNPDNALGAADAMWAGVLNSNINYTSRWAIGDPVNALTGTQTVNVLARKGSNSATPTLQVNLYENGTLVQSVIATTDITSTSGQTISGTFDASAITDRTLIEIEVIQTGVTGSPTVRNTAQIDYIELSTTESAGSPVTVELVASTLSLAAQPLDLSLNPLSVELVASSLTLAAQALDLTLAPLEVPLSPAGLVLTAQELALSLSAKSVQLVPAMLVITAQALTPQIAGSTVEVELVPAILSLTPSALALQLGAKEVELVPVDLTMSAQALELTLQALAVELTPATLLIVAQPLRVDIVGGGEPQVRIRQVGFLNHW